MESDWSWISSDGVIKKNIISIGNSPLHPFDGSRCNVRFIDISVDKDKQIQGYPQVGSEADITMGEGVTSFERILGRLLQTMVSQEMSAFEVKLDDALFTMRIELINFEYSSKPLYRLTEEEKLAEAERLKVKASELILHNRYEDAVALLRRAFHCVCWAGGNMKEKGYCELYFSIIANLSLCSLKLNDNERTVALCDRVLCLRPNYVKCLLRRATALDFLQESTRAKEDVLAAINIEPNNKTAEQLLEKIKTHIAKQKTDYSVLVKKMLQVDKK